MQGIPEHGHEAVMVGEVLRGLDLEGAAEAAKGAGEAGGRLVVMDCTVGRGGHALRMAEVMGRAGGGLLIAMDVDPENLKYARKRLESAEYPGKSRVELRTFHANFGEADDVLQALEVEKVDGLLADFGVSTNQLLESGHGLSFSGDEALDMRLDPRIKRKASDLLAQWDEKELAHVLQEYAQERFAWRIARKIIQTRATQPILNTGHLAQLVRSVVPPPRTKRGQIDPATRTFQALRMAVNSELESIEDLLAAVPEIMRPSGEGSRGGRAAFLSFHSGEDRFVKQAARKWEDAGLCKALTKKPEEAGEEEIHRNPRSRSAKLRTIQWTGTVSMESKPGNRKKETRSSGMTREAKIGMLTGLGVIVLIGVLLSKYLGDPSSTASSLSGASVSGMGGAGVTSGMGATGRMAQLPVGAGYRQEVMQPVTVPAMARAEDAPLAGGTEMSAPIVTGLGMLPPTAFAAETTQNRMPASNGPLVVAPVSPVAIGPSPTETYVGAGTPPVIVMQDGPQATGQVAESVQSPVTPVGTKVTGLPGTTTTTSYTVAAGDTLAKIAKKFYDSSKNSDVQRIVAANPSVLKDADSTLLPGKTLKIPVMKKTVTPVMVNGAGSLVGFKNLPPAVLQATEPAMIYKPVDSAAAAPVRDAAAAKVDAKKTKIYEVQSGDTLEKIARKIAPSKVTEMVQKLTSINGIKDPTALQVGMKLKVPA